MLLLTFNAVGIPLYVLYLQQFNPV